MLKKILKSGYFDLSDQEEEPYRSHNVQDVVEHVSFMHTLTTEDEGSTVEGGAEGTTKPYKKKRGPPEGTTATLPKDKPDCYIENEIAILKRVRHPNIVRLHEVIVPSK